MTLLIEQIVNGLAVGATYGIFAMGFGLVFATMNILNLAHGTFATWGAIIALAAATALGLPFMVAVVLGLAGAGVIGVLVDQLGFEPLRRRGGGTLGPIITSIGFWIILGELALVVTSATFHTFPPNGVPTELIHMGELSILPIQLINIAIAIVLGSILYQFVQRSRAGAAMRAVGWSERAASLSGINPRWVIIGTSFLAAAIAGLAGVLSGLATNNVSFTLGEGLMLKGFAAVIVGGYGDVRGAVIGGFLIGLSEVLGAQYISTTFRDAISFGLLIAFLLLRPRGIFGAADVGVRA